MNGLFRKSALEKLSSPEQLDKTIVITSPLSWLAIIGTAIIIVSFIVWSVLGTLPTTIYSSGIIVDSENIIDVHSPYKGTVLKFYVKEGEVVSIGDKIADIQVSETDSKTLLSTQEGKVSQVIYRENENINKYDNIIKITPTEQKILLCYVPVETGKQITKNMKAIITPTSFDEKKYGHMEASIISVDDYATSIDDMKNQIGTNNEFINMFASDMPMMAVVCSINKDNDTESGYYWSSSNGKDIAVSDGTICGVKIIIDESAPISRLFPADAGKLED